MSRAAPRVVQLVSSLAIGGAERAALELAAGLGARGFASELWVLTPPALAVSDALEEEVRERGVPLRRLALGSIRRRSERERFDAALREARVALVNAHNRPIDWQATWLARRAGVAAVYTRQLGYDDLSRRQRLIYRATGHAASAVVALTQAVARHLRQVERVPAHKLRVIPDGIDTARYRPPAPEERARTRRALAAGDDFVWLVTARLVRQKGLEHLLDALARLPAPRRRQVWIAGSGPLAEPLRERAAALDVAPRWLGPRDDVPALLGAADGYVCSSLGEGQGLSLVEALASGLPVVAPRLGCVGELGPDGLRRFGPGIEGWARGHDASQIAAAMHAVEQLGTGYRGSPEARAARLFVEQHFSKRCMLEGYATLYRELLGQPAARRPGARPRAAWPATPGL